MGLVHVKLALVQSIDNASVVTIEGKMLHLPKESKNILAAFWGYGFVHMSVVIKSNSVSYCLVFAILMQRGSEIFMSGNEDKRYYSNF